MFLTFQSPLQFILTKCQMEVERPEGGPCGHHQSSAKMGRGHLCPPARQTGCPHSQGLLAANPKHDPTISFINIEMRSFKAFRDRNDMTLLDS